MACVLSIQSQVVYGHVGNSAAQFALQRLGHEVWALPSVVFSNHPGHGGFEGRALDAAEMMRLLDGLDRAGVLKSVDAVLSGYLGGPAQVDVVDAALDRVRAQSPRAIYVCDPVIGDAGKGAYVAEGLPEAIRDRLVPRADILKPNTFELEFLTGRAASSPDAVQAGARALACPLTVVSSVPLPDKPQDIGAMAVTPQTSWVVSAPRLDRPAAGTGDLFTALVLAHHLDGLGPQDMLARAAASLDRLLNMEVDTSRPREVPLIAGQDALPMTDGGHLRVRKLS